MKMFDRVLKACPFQQKVANNEKLSQESNLESLASESEEESNFH